MDGQVVQGGLNTRGGIGGLAEEEGKGGDEWV